jgi:hypothetical protein
MGRAGRAQNISPRATTRVNQAAVAQFAPGREVEIAPLALPERPLLPAKTEPAQILVNRLPEFRPAPIPIEIFDS